LASQHPLVTSWSAPPQPMRFADTSDPASRYWIEVHGQDFGGADLGASAFVGGVACRRTVWVNDSVVKCDAPSIAGSGLVVSVVVAGSASFDFDVDRTGISSAARAYRHTDYWGVAGGARVAANDPP